MNRAASIACFVLSGLFSPGLAAPAAAQQWSAETVTLHQRCYAEANAIGFSGEKTGYAASYNAAVAACVSRGTERYAGYHPLPHRARAPVTGNCPPGAPPMYRGTLYCPRH